LSYEFVSDLSAIAKSDGGFSAWDLGCGLWPQQVFLVKKKRAEKKNYLFFSGF